MAHNCALSSVLLLHRDVCVVDMVGRFSDYTLVAAT